MRVYAYFMSMMLLTVSCANTNTSSPQSIADINHPHNRGVAEMTVAGEAVGTDLELTIEGETTSDKVCYAVKLPESQDSVNFKASVHFEKGSIDELHFQGTLELVEEDGTIWGKAFYLFGEAAISGAFDQDYDLCIYNKAKLAVPFSLKVEAIFRTETD